MALFFPAAADPHGQEAITDELTRGRDRVDQLLRLLLRGPCWSWPELQLEEEERLTREAVASLTSVSSLLESCRDAAASRDCARASAAEGVDLGSSGETMREAAAGGSGSSSSCRKRKKCLAGGSDAAVVETNKDSKKRYQSCSSSRSSTESRTSYATHLYDGCQWRKYGQKDIKGSVPRSYFRCTYSDDSPQSCRATKQVQQLSEDPPLYSVTYSGDHTCRQQALLQTFDVYGSVALPMSTLEHEQRQQQQILVFGSSSSSSSTIAADHEHVMSPSSEKLEEHRYCTSINGGQDQVVFPHYCRSPTSVLAQEPVVVLDQDLKRETSVPLMVYDSNGGLLLPHHGSCSTLTLAQKPVLPDYHTLNLKQEMPPLPSEASASHGGRNWLEDSQLLDLLEEFLCMPELDVSFS